MEEILNRKILSFDNGLEQERTLIDVQGWHDLSQHVRAILLRYINREINRERERERERERNELIHCARDKACSTESE